MLIEEKKRINSMPTVELDIWNKAPARYLLWISLLWIRLTRDPMIKFESSAEDKYPN